MKNDSNEILDDFALEVKEIEEQASKIIEDAQLKKEKLISEAKSESVAYISKKQADLEKKKNESIQKQKQKIVLKKKEILKKGDKEISEFEIKTRKNLSKAVNFVMDELNKTIEEN